MNTATACDALGGSAVVFVGRVLSDSGERYGNRSARVLIEEPLLNINGDSHEVDIDNSFGTSCYYPLETGERYIIFASRSEPKRASLKIEACSNSLPLKGNEHVLDALRIKAEGGPPSLLGRVRHSRDEFDKEGSIPGVTVIARSATAQYEAVTNASGAYQIRGIAPGRYQLEVSKAGFVPNQEHNHRSSGHFVVNKATHQLEADRASGVSVGPNSCTLWDLSMWPDGRISGTVTNNSAEPLSNVSVQAFAFDKLGERRSSPVKTGTTDAQGHYVIGPLPGGPYVVGVNADSYRDVEPYPPTVYSSGAKISLDEGALVTNIDLVVPPKRSPTTLHLQVRGPDGNPVKGASISLTNLAGIQRWSSREETSDDGNMDIPVYLNERYTVSAYSSKSELFKGQAGVDVTTENPSAIVVLARAAQ